MTDIWPLPPTKKGKKKKKTNSIKIEWIALWWLHVTLGFLFIMAVLFIWDTYIPQCKSEPLGEERVGSNSCNIIREDLCLWEMTWDENKSNKCGHCGHTSKLGLRK